MIIELRPRIFTKKWFQWLDLRLRQDIFDEIEKEKFKLNKKVIDAQENWTGGAK